MPLLNQPDTRSASSFAGLIAALAAPKTQAPHSGFDDLLDGLEDDVATISYERALQAHGRYKPADPFRLSQDKPDSVAPPSLPPDPVASRAAAEPKPAPATAEQDPEAARKRASVTLRMSRGDCARLQKLAAEAGMTVSAYLRFCAFEVESLRAQVKTALAEMRAPHKEPPPAFSARWLRLFRLHA